MGSQRSEAAQYAFWKTKHVFAPFVFVEGPWERCCEELGAASQANHGPCPDQSSVVSAVHAGDWEYPELHSAPGVQHSDCGISILGELTFLLLVQ